MPTIGTTEQKPTTGNPRDETGGPGSEIGAPRLETRLQLPIAERPFKIGRTQPLTALKQQMIARPRRQTASCLRGNVGCLPSTS